MVEKFFLENSYILMARSLKTPYGELDRLFRSPRGEYLIFEVKSSLNPWDEEPLVHRKQKQRLYRNRDYLSSFLGPVELIYAFVGGNEMILYEESFESF